MMLAILSVALFSGCTGVIGTGSEVEKGPVETGPSVQELKASPCACTEIPMSFLPSYAV